MTNETKRKSFTPDEDVLDEIKSWYVPVVEDKYNDPSVTNMMGKRQDWTYEPPPEEPEIPQPPTLEEIEAIRQDAHDEGFAEGKQAGFEQGQSEGLEQGREDGHKEGFEKGQTEGLDAGEQIIQEKAQLWDDNIQKLIEPLHQVDEKVEKQLVELAVHLAKSIVHVEVQTNQEVINSALKEALAVLPVNAELYIIRMHPEDIALFEDKYSEADIEKRRWHFQPDVDLVRGGCEVITEASSVDMTVEKRSKDILDNFLLQAGLAND